MIAECILSAGFDPNAKEYCGITPLSIAVNSKNLEMCQLLLDCHANVQGPIYAGIPSPRSMARKMELAEIFEMLSPDEDEVLDDDLKLYDPGRFRKQI